MRPSAVTNEAFLDVRRDAAATMPERPALEAFLEDYRTAVVTTTSGLSEHNARHRLVPSATTIAGLVKHLRVIEMNWFQRILGDVCKPDLPLAINWNDYAHSSFTLEPGDTLGHLLAGYQQQCELSRQIAARHDLSDTADHPALGRVSLRWIYLHMIDETARHVGHADILREQLDAATR